MTKLRIRFLTIAGDQSESDCPDQKALTDLDQLVRSELTRLLLGAIPTQLRRHQLVHLLEQERPSLSNPIVRVNLFFSEPHHLRTNQFFRSTFEVEPYPWLRDQFDLHFGQAEISETEIYKLALKTRDYFRNNFCFPAEISTAGLLQVVLHRLTNPRWDEPVTQLDLWDFVRIWKMICQKHFGDTYNTFFELLLNRVNEINSDLAILNPSSITKENSLPSSGDQFLSQTELDWLKHILAYIQLGWSPPSYPISTGPKNKITKAIETLCRILHLQSKSKVLPASDVTRLKDHLAKSCKDWLIYYKQYKPLTNAEVRSIVRALKHKEDI